MAARHDFDGFYRQELHFRANLHYPPFSRLIRLEFRHQNENECKLIAERMAEKIKYWIDD
jgi:primosomal protein N' (replication factor Y)